jgi:hypothetical protein
MRASSMGDRRLQNPDRVLSVEEDRSGAQLNVPAKYVFAEQAMYPWEQRERTVTNMVHHATHRDSGHFAQRCEEWKDGQNTQGR